MSDHRDDVPRRAPRDPRKPLPGEMSAKQQRFFRQLIVGIVLVGIGAMLGFAFNPEPASDAKERLAEVEGKLAAANNRIAELERALQYKAAPAAAIAGQLKPKDRERHEREGKRYAKALRNLKAQGASELFSWFITRWDGLLDQPERDDRIRRRAELLSRLVGGMAENLHPEDYVPWQAEFLNGNWLGELHFDMDGDGLPGKRSQPNPHDGFADTSVCQIAMAFNQAVTDARVLVMPDMRCDRPEAKMSVFLQGATLNDALTDLVQALKRERFLVVEREEKGLRLILVGQGSRGVPQE